MSVQRLQQTCLSPDGTQLAQLKPQQACVSMHGLIDTVCSNILLMVPSMPSLNSMMLVRQVQGRPRTSSGMECYLLLASAIGHNCSMDTRR
jgi:hypothetical protein